ncbi:Nucleoside-diphosphate-sugar epimerase [Micromonospora matsumotoense]|uniref:Nucleoside-diphosphate-sugar epimerase n=1 Tax=Micromonospora matsumotoense TaxID=121616 RepID=A0A1C4ZHC6_9ACTN|nr:SDR family oxidoreductase [Micromonospora matsumotoense]SCF32388.1 Nucleoside-diphosphate-sugar epimerase [Micromonospora matsumotoense]
MRVFVTGASGWIGSATVDELLAAGHDVVGLARSDTSAAALEAKGVTVRRGDLDDLDGIRAGAADAEAVIHLANKHDFDNPAVSNKAERAAIEAIGDTLEGSGRPFLFASGIIPVGGGRPATEDDASPFHGPDTPRGGGENLALDYLARGVHVVGVRFAPTTHGAGDNGLMTTLVGIAREKGVACYIGDGTNRWPAVHRSDAARLVHLGLEKAPAGSLLHAIAEEGVPTRQIAEAIGHALDLPVASISAENAPAHFGWMGGFFGLDIPASSTRTQEILGWTPTGPTLLDDLNTGAYSHA